MLGRLIAKVQWIPLLFVTFFIAIVVGIVRDVYVTRNYVNSNIERNISDLKAELLFYMGTVAQDLISTSEDKDFLSYVETRSGESRLQVQKRFQNRLENQNTYYMMRFIDSSGQERIRVERLPDGSIVNFGFSELPDNENKYYFQDAMRLNVGEIYLSPIELYIEDGKIAYPPRPTVRFATPVFDSRGDKRGILIINRDMSDLLARIDQINERYPQAHILLSNSDGYWLHGISPADEWGFMYPDRKDKTFQNKFPHAWLKTINKDNGAIINREGLFIFKKIYPIQAIQELTDLNKDKFSYYSRYLSVKDFHLMITVHGTFDEAFRMISRTVLPRYFVFVGLLIFLLISWKVYRSWKSRQ